MGSARRENGSQTSSAVESNSAVKGEREDVKDPEDIRNERWLDWLEGTMPEDEREQMLELPDGDPTDPGEVERRAAFAELLESLPQVPAPDSLWAEVRDRIESAHQTDTPQHQARPIRILQSRRFVAGLAAALLLAVSFLVIRNDGSPEKAPGATRHSFIVLEESDYFNDAESQVWLEELGGSWSDGPGDAAQLYGEMLRGPQ